MRILSPLIAVATALDYHDRYVVPSADFKGFAMNRNAPGLLCLIVFFSFLLPAPVYSDFIIDNMLAEVGVAAGDVSDGVGGHDVNEAMF